MSNLDEPIANQPPDFDKEVVLEEYKVLRQELLKRIEFRYQYIAITLTAAGLFLTAGLRLDSSASVLLIYPILAMLLSFGWVYNGHVVVYVATYIRDNIESKLKDLQYETRFRDLQAAEFKVQDLWKPSSDKNFATYGPYGPLGFISTAGIFLITQVVAVVLGVTKLITGNELGLTEFILLIFDLIAIPFTFRCLWLLYDKRSQEKI